MQHLTIATLPRRHVSANSRGGPWSASSESKGVDPSRPCEHNEGDVGRPTRPIDHPAAADHAIASAGHVHEKVAPTVGRPVADAVPFLADGWGPLFRGRVRRM